MTSREVYEKLEGFYEKARQNPKTWIGLGILLSVILLIWLPPWRVSHFEINNATVEADLENQYRATLAQILGGIAVGIGIYFAWGNLTTAREGQITERFTRAVDQLGSEKIGIRLGGIYSLERVSKESEKDYWSIMEILTAFVRENSPNTGIENRDVHGILKQKKVSLDIQAILSVIRRRNNPFNVGEFNSLNLSSSYLGWADLRNINLAGANLQWTDFYGSGLQWANFERAILEEVIFEDANLKRTNFQGAKLGSANFKKASLIEAIFVEADLSGADFIEADLQGANFERAILGGVNLKGAKHLTVDQLSKAKTLYNAKLDPELEKPLREKYPALFEKPDE